MYKNYNIIITLQQDQIHQILYVEDNGPAHCSTTDLDLYDSLICYVDMILKEVRQVYSDKVPYSNQINIQLKLEGKNFKQLTGYPYEN